MIISVKKIFSLILISTFCFAGCTNSSEFYVQGLVNLESQQKDKAAKNFEKAIKNGSSVEVLLSLKELEKLNIPKSKMLKLSKLAVNSKKNPEAETYNYYLQSLDFAKYYQGAAIPHIYYKDYKKEKIALPSIIEQKRIVKILDEVFIALEKKKQNGF